MKYAAPIVLFLLLDVAIGTLAFRLSPDRIDERSFRTESSIYHHDLRPMKSEWAQWGPVRYRVHTNSLGFKDASERRIPLESAERRVILIGDSFTEGLGLPYEQTFAGLIAEALRAQSIEVLNAGVTSYSPTIYARKIRYLMDAGLDFDEVVVFLDISDIEDEASHYVLDAEGRVVDRSPEATSRFHVMPKADASAFSRFKRFLVAHSLTFRLADTVRDRLAGPGAGGEAGTTPRSVLEWASAKDRGNWPDDPVLMERYATRGLANASQAMDRLHEDLTAAGRKLTVVVYPWPFQVLASNPDSLQVRYWREWSERRRVAFVDLFPAFVGVADAEKVIADYYIPGDCHFNAAGSRRFADAFLARFQTRKTAPAPE
jgi:lysophospholipase L1-like esterase